LRVLPRQGARTSSRSASPSRTRWRTGPSFVAPTSEDDRIALAAEATDGWLYLVTVAGTTGARTELSPALAPLVQRTRALTDEPHYAGFGIATPEQAAAAADLADGVVVGSAALEAAENGPAALERFVAQLRAALA
jgi:tryptophan synthase alpha chain